MKSATLLATTLMLLLAAPLGGQVPRTMSYQGVMAD